MGFAIKRQDGSYRAWNANGKDSPLYEGESWEVLASCPVITVPPPAKSQQELDCEAAKAAIDTAVASGTTKDIQAALAAVKKVI